MARNKVQFQKGLSEADFSALYGSEEACRRAVSSWRWPGGFECPACGGRDHCVLDRRDLYQCNACRTQTSLTAGTIFANTKLALTTWFRAMYLVTQSKQGISTVELGRRLGVRQTTAWSIKSKLTQVMLERDAKKLLDGRVEMDDAYLGGRRSDGKAGRGAPGKTPFVASVETTDEGKPKRVQLRRVKRFTKKAIKALAGRTLKPDRTRRHRRARLLSRARGLGRSPRPADRRASRTRREAPPVPVGQHGARQHQERDQRHLPRGEKARRPNARRVRVALQPPLRSGRHDSAPRLGRDTHAADAVSATKVD